MRFQGGDSWGLGVTRLIIGVMDVSFKSIIMLMKLVGTLGSGCLLVIGSQEENENKIRSNIKPK